MQQRLDGGRWQLVAEFVEIESGKRAKRPQLDAALAACKKHKAKLVVAKLDRLSRNVSFLLKLINSGCEVLFADLPELNGAMGRFMLTTMASVAELEAGLISERTKAALDAAKQAWREARPSTARRFLPPNIGKRLANARCSLRLSSPS